MANDTIRNVRGLQAAFLSIQEHGQRGVLGQFMLPPAYRPVPIEEAIERLTAAAEPEAARLRLGATHAWLRRNPKDVATAQRLLGRGSLRQSTANTLGGTITDPLDFVLRNTSAADGQPYETRNASSETTFDSVSLVTTVTVSVEVKRAIEPMAALIDPRGWATGAPLFFEDSYQVVTDATGAPTFAGTTPVPSPSVRLGQSWEGVFYENFRWQWNDITTSSFQNLLNMDFSVREGAIEYTFLLRECLSSTVGLLTRAGGLDVDSGFARLQQRGEWVHVVAQKSVRFTDMTPYSVETPIDIGQTLNYMAPSIVGGWMEFFTIQGVTSDPPKTTLAPTPGGDIEGAPAKGKVA